MTGESISDLGHVVNGVRGLVVAGQGPPVSGLLSRQDEILVKRSSPLLDFGFHVIVVREQHIIETETRVVNEGNRTTGVTICSQSLEETSQHSNGPKHVETNGSRKEAQ